MILYCSQIFFILQRIFIYAGYISEKHEQSDLMHVIF